MRTWVAIAAVIWGCAAGCDIKLEFPATESSAVIVTVDGLSFAKTLLDIYVIDRDNYLEQAVEGMDIDVPDNHVIPYLWSRNSNETPQAVDGLRALFREQFDRARDEGKAFIVVSHSWGTVLTCAALALEADSGDPIVCDLLILAGSPLGTSHAHDEPLYDLEERIADYVRRSIEPLDYDAHSLPFHRCVNYWAWSDLISGPVGEVIPGAEDVKLDPFDVEDGPIRRSILTTPAWHKYDSMQNDGLLDNDDYLAGVARTIRQTLAAVDQP